MELRNLKTFQVVANQLNLTKAAELLGYSQPTITVQIQSLEKELGQPLFTRVGKRTFLTPAGKLLKQHTDRLFSVIEELEADFRRLQHPFGRLTIAAPEFYCTRYMPSLMSAYIKRYPDVKLQVNSYNSQQTLKLVSEHEADVGLIAGVTNQPEISSVIIGYEDLVLVTTPEILQDFEVSHVLQQQPFISYQECCNLEGMIHECLQELDFQPESVVQCSSEETIKQVVLKNTGVALLSAALIEEELQSGVLKELHRYRNKLATSLIYLSARAEESTIRSFVHLVEDIWPSAEKNLSAG